MEADLTVSGAVSCALCDLDGRVLPDPSVSPSAPESPANAALWLEPGEGGGTLATLADVCIRVPSKDTYRVQEYHLPIYHALCMMVEYRYFSA